MFIKLYAIALPVFFAIDMVWLGLVAKNFYRAQIGMLLKPDVNWIAAIIFYLIFIAGLVMFVIAPAMEHSSWRHALFGAHYLDWFVMPHMISPIWLLPKIDRCW